MIVKIQYLKWNWKVFKVTAFYFVGLRAFWDSGGEALKEMQYCKVAESSYNKPWKSCELNDIKFDNIVIGLLVYVRKQEQQWIK